MLLTEAYVETLAPTARALEGGRALADTLEGLYAGAGQLSGLCPGSASRPYAVTVELNEPPRCKCTCPSRQSPCKHAIGLLLSYIRDPGRFAPLPETFGDTATYQQMTFSEMQNAAVAPKWRDAQRRALERCISTLSDLWARGLSSLDAKALQTLLAEGKALTEARLPGIRERLDEFALLYSTGAVDDALTVLTNLYALGRRALEELGRPGGHLDPMLDSFLGRAWTLSDLESLGRFSVDARLLQLSFMVSENAAARRLEETGVWIDLDGGGLVFTTALRPLAATRFTHESDSFHDVALVPKLFRYPLHDRVRWKGFSAASIEQAHLRDALAQALPDFEALDAYVRERLSDPFGWTPPVALTRFSRVCRTQDGLALADGAGRQLALSGQARVLDLMELLDMSAFEACLVRIGLSALGTYTAQPLCLLGARSLFRLDS